MLISSPHMPERSYKCLKYEKSYKCLKYEKSYKCLKCAKVPKVVAYAWLPGEKTPVGGVFKPNCVAPRTRLSVIMPISTA